MKVGTDANILGVWCNIGDAKTALDIGTGSGVIAMILASRSKNMVVDAIDLDSDSVTESATNFRLSPYSNRLHSIHDDFKNYSFEPNKKYDLIITNPPFFSSFPVSTINNSRKKARQTVDLNHEQLIKGVSGLITDDGKFNVVLPYDIHKKFIAMAAESSLYVNRQLVIFPKPGKMPNRINIEFKKRKSHKIISNDFYVRDTNGEFSQQYKLFFKDHLILTGVD